MIYEVDGGDGGGDDVYDDEVDGGVGVDDDDDDNDNATENRKPFPLIRRMITGRRSAITRVASDRIVIYFTRLC